MGVFSTTWHQHHGNTTRAKDHSVIECIEEHESWELRLLRVDLNFSSRIRDLSPSKTPPKTDLLLQVAEIWHPNGGSRDAFCWFIPFRHVWSMMAKTKCKTCTFCLQCFFWETLRTPRPYASSHSSRISRPSRCRERLVWFFRLKITWVFQLVVVVSFRFFELLPRSLGRWSNLTCILRKKHHQLATEKGWRFHVIFVVFFCGEDFLCIWK